MARLFDMIVCSVVVGFAGCGMSAAAAAPPHYAVSVVPTRPDSSGMDIDKKGRVAVRAPGNLAFRCSLKKCIQIPALPNDQGSDVVTPEAINDAGWVVGTSPISANVYHAMLFDGSAVVDVGAFDEDECGGCTLGSYARGINNRGQVVGVSDTAKGANWSRAFRWESGVMKKLPTLGGPSSYATAINNHGDVAGSARTNDVESHAFIFRHGVMQDLGVLGTGMTSVASAINDGGQVVGWSLTQGWNVMRPFLYTDGVISEIPPPPVQFLHSEATDINDKGWVVGLTSGPGETNRAWVFDGVDAYELSLLLSAEDQATWDVQSAMGINNDGEIVANGRAKSDGSRHVLVLTPMP